MHINNASRYIKEINKDKYLIFNDTDENKELLEKYDNVFSGIMSKIKKIDDDWLEYSKGYKKIKFNSDDNLPINKIFIVMIKIIVVIIVVTNVNENDNENENVIVILICHSHLHFIYIDSYFIIIIFFLHNIKMSHYWFNRQEILQKAKKKILKRESC